MKFVGNKKALSFLQKSIEKGHVGHAYIFSGPEHLGKFLLAKMFAQALILDGKLEENNIEIKQDALFDMVIVEPEVTEKNHVTKQRDITIETVRVLQKTLSLFPYHGRKKVLIINDAHRLNTSSQNALLKTLEEPNDTCIMILVTHEANKLLPTIQSRCATLNFALVSESLEAVMGRPGLAKIYAENPEEKNIFEQGEILLRKLPRLSIGERMKEAEALSKDVVKTLKILMVWVWLLRDEVKEAEITSKKKAYFSIDKIEESINLLKSTNANARLALESLFLEIEK